MANGTLIVHTKGAHRVSLDALRALPAPEPMGSRHKPIPHHILVDEVLDAASNRGLEVTKQQFAVARKGQMLFAVLDFKSFGEAADYSPSFGFRSSTGQQLNIRGVAGARVSLCDNLMMSGSEFVMKHKLTTRLNLPELVSAAFNRFHEQSNLLTEHIEEMKVRPMTDTQAKIRIFDVFNQGALPLHLFDDVSRLYFRPQDEHLDCQPRTEWGLHNAHTRAIKVLSPVKQFTATRDVGRVFNLGIGPF